MNPSAAEKLRVSTCRLPNDPRGYSVIILTERRLARLMGSVLKGAPLSHYARRRVLLNVAEWEIARLRERNTTGGNP